MKKYLYQYEFRGVKYLAGYFPNMHAAIYDLYFNWAFGIKDAKEYFEEQKPIFSKVK